MLYSGKVTNKHTGMPIANVPVTDGRNVVLTDASGAYTLPGWERTHTVAVCALTKEDHDWFYFTDGKGGTYDFAISPADEVENFELLHVSDTEIRADRDVEWVAFMGQLCEQKMPAFLMHTASDELVPVMDSLDMAQALSRAQIPYELHVYPNALHGVSLGNKTTSLGRAHWENDAIAEWVRHAAVWADSIV